MLVLDKRISKTKYIQIDVCDKKLNNEIEMWLSPFFCVTENDDIGFVSIATIKDTKLNKEDYTYENNVFWVNNTLDLNHLLYVIMSIVRALFKNVALLYGYKNMHAACFDYYGRGVLINSSRNNGKTTLVLNAIMNKEFSLVANDQVMYNENNNCILGYPAGVGIRNNSVDSSNMEKIRSSCLWYIDDPFQKQRKPIIHIKQLSKIFNCQLKDKTELGLFVNYTKSERIDELVIEKSFVNLEAINNLLLPLDRTYSPKLLESCKATIKNVLCEQLNSKKELQKDYKKAIQFNVKCGINMIENLLGEIKKILKNE